MRTQEALDESESLAKPILCLSVMCFNRDSNGLAHKADTMLGKPPFSIVGPAFNKSQPIYRTRLVFEPTKKEFQQSLRLINRAAAKTISLSFSL